MAAVLFSPLVLRGLTLPNRITVAPMCQYMATDGVPGDWHLVHLGQFAQSGAGLIMIEATGVEADGRITPNCTGLYNDAQEAAFARILHFCRGVGGSKIGIQLSHSGRKGSTAAPWEGAGWLENGWTVAAPSATPYLPNWPNPEALDADGAGPRQGRIRRGHAAGRPVRV